MRRYAWILAAVVTFAVLSAHAAEVKWLPDYDDALKQAIAEKKLVMVDVYTDWCHWCKKLDKDVYTDKAVQERLTKGFICVKINPERTSKSKKVAKDMGVRGYPYIGFFDADGKKIRSISGYVSAEKFRAILDQVANNSHDNEVPKPKTKSLTKQKRR